MVQNSPAPTPHPVPRHVAIIMDGNGRWAQRRGLPRVAGHRRGAQAAKDTVLTALDLGIEYLTLYSFSSENWSRPLDEVDDLMGLLRFTMQREASTMHERGVRLRVIGDRTRLPADVLATIEAMEAKTAGNRRMTAVIALSYGSRDEIAAAVRRMAADAVAGRLDPEAITPETVSGYLYTHDIPDPDLVIRTSGEQRISNFLLWQSAYAEFVFPETLWPDFDRTALENALASYGQRDRRYGGRKVG
ncbi:MAG: isoprenyl transferase [Alphaproteobacteria bacterium]|nr:isoprenyl transferase [Alphaproteobacteria bacterium]